jgi:hypothetical protein
MASVLSISSKITGFSTPRTLRCAIASARRPFNLVRRKLHEYVNKQRQPKQRDVRYSSITLRVKIIRKRIHPSLLVVFDAHAPATISEKGTKCQEIHNEAPALCLQVSLPRSIVWNVFILLVFAIYIFVVCVFMLPIWRRYLQNTIENGKLEGKAFQSEREGVERVNLGLQKQKAHRDFGFFDHYVSITRRVLDFLSALFHEPLSPSNSLNSFRFHSVGYIYIRDWAAGFGIRHGQRYYFPLPANEWVTRANESQGMLKCIHDKRTRRAAQVSLFRVDGKAGMGMLAQQGAIHDATVWI